MDCELAYYKSRDQLPLKVWCLIGFALPWLLLAVLHGSLPSGLAHARGFRGTSTGSPLLDVSIMIMVGSVLLGGALRGLRVWLHRRAFLAPVRA